MSIILLKRRYSTYRETEYNFFKLIYYAFPQQNSNDRPSYAIIRYYTQNDSNPQGLYEHFPIEEDIFVTLEHVCIIRNPGYIYDCTEAL